MGRNKALDICVRAFTGAMATTRSGQLDVQTLIDYGNGMKMVRCYLTNPKTAKEPETLVATYLLSLCQVSLNSNAIADGAGARLTSDDRHTLAPMRSSKESTCRAWHT